MKEDFSIYLTKKGDILLKYIKPSNHNNNHNHKGEQNEP